MLHKIEVSDIPGRLAKGNRKVQMDLTEFVRSEWPAAKVDIDGHYKTISSAYAAYRNAASAMNIGVTVLSRGGELYLMRDIPKL